MTSVRLVLGQEVKIPVIMTWPSRFGVDHVPQIMIDGEGGGGEARRG
jgi:hypothetical protein